MHSYAILPPLGFSEAGPRPQNEDCIFPGQGSATVQSHVFMVCDGVGGAQKGELASAITVQALSGYILERTRLIKETIVPSDAWLQEGLRDVEKHFDALFAQQFLLKGMATTLTLLVLESGQAMIAHIGDSRVYQIRHGQLLFQTADHSYVGNLVRTGELTPEEAAAHPKKNLITRAIQGSYEPATLDIVHLTDVQPGDYFFLCSDGVWECISNAELLNVIGATDMSNEEKVQLIQNHCAIDAHDNYSGYLVQVAPNKSVPLFQP